MSINILKKIIILAAIVFVAAGFYISNNQRATISVNNAYVSGQIIKIKAPLSGMIEDVNIQEGEKISQGDILFIYDQLNSQYQLEKSRERFVQSIRDEYRNCMEDSIRLGEIELKKLEYKHTKKQLVRGEKLKKSNLLAESMYENIVYQFDSSSINNTISSVENMMLEYSNPEPILQRPKVKLSRLSYEEEINNHKLAKVSAPAAGYIYELLVYPNQYVEKGEVIAMLVATDQIRIEANVLEAEVGILEPNMKVDIVSDLYPNHKFKGHIHSVVPSTAASFSPIPRNNVDSNWIKVSQRVPVLIEIDDENKEILPIGSSARLHIHLDQFIQPDPLEKQSFSADSSQWNSKASSLISSLIEEENKIAVSNTKNQWCML